MRPSLLRQPAAAVEAIRVFRGSRLESEVAILLEREVCVCMCLCVCLCVCVCLCMSECVSVCLCGDGAMKQERGRHKEEGIEGGVYRGGR